MISALRGQVEDIQPDALTLDVHGVGYLVYCHLRTVGALALGSEAHLFIHTAVSDDAIRLYGFLSRDELVLFQRLIGVERIGPKAALGILGRAELPVMLSAIRNGDTAMVASVPGIGRKTAERVILELRDKLNDVGTAFSVEVVGKQITETRLRSAVEGLVALGFRESDAETAVASAAKSHPDAEVATIVSAALRRLDAGLKP